MNKATGQDLLGPDARRVARAAAEIGGSAVEAIEASLPGAIAGQRQEVRAYVAAYRELIDRILDGLGQSHSDPTEVQPGGPWRNAVLEREAMKAPFTDWVGTLGLGEGTAVALVASLRELLPGAEPLPRPPRRRPPVWDLDEQAVARFFRAVLEELERPRAPFERIRSLLELNQTELARLFGVRRQAVDNWGVHGVPAERLEKLATLGEITDLLAAKLKADRVPGVVRRPAPAYGGRSALAAIADGDQELVLAELRDAFDWASAA